MSGVQVIGDSVSLDVDGRSVLNQVSVRCTPGEMTALVGPSGSGKTTLLHILGLLQKPSRGTVMIDDACGSAWSSRKRRSYWRDRAAFVLQDYGIMDDESIEYNVCMRKSLLSQKPVSDGARLDKALGLTGLLGREREPARHLSGGEKQRLGIARAIYKDADCILADEPTASLDRKNRAHVADMLRERAKAGVTVIVATHDELLMDEADECCEVRRVDRDLEIAR